MEWQETLERVRSAVAACVEANLGCLRIESPEFAVELHRRPDARPHAVAPRAVSDLASSNGRSRNGAVLHDEPQHALLRAEFVGVVRFARPLVGVGATVSEDRELAYVEALGIRNPIRSGSCGRVAEILVADGQAVDYGQALFALENS